MRLAHLPSGFLSVMRAKASLTGDFAIPQKRVAIYVDGAAFHTGINLRRDRYIRNRLREGSPAWKVVELKATDLKRGAELVEEIHRIV